MKKLVIDFDNTISITENGDYQNSKPVISVIDMIKKYKKDGFYIIINSSRNMRTFNGNIGLINKNTLPIMIDWLDRNDVVYDEIIVGKPWCGFDGFYIDDRAIRPSEFITMSLSEIDELLKIEKKNIDRECK
jgi:hypothetical protein